VATHRTSIRRGLPRVAGGPSWPPADAAAPEHTVLDHAEPAAPTEQEHSTLSAVISKQAQIRRGLPRTAGGEPWPPGATVVQLKDGRRAGTPGPADMPTPTGASAPRPAATSLRRGLPRLEGGDPWPPAGIAPPELAAPPTAPPAPPPAPKPSLSEPTPGTTVTGAAATDPTRISRTEPKRYGRYTLAQWAGAGVLAGGGLLLVAGAAVLLVRWLLSASFMQDFIATYPGEYHLPEAAPIGLPAWVGWQHFFNAFLMVLIIRSGLQVRRQKRPSAFWIPRWNTERKISLSLWFHQSLDILWLVNGLVFVVLLVLTGQWLRIVPSSWEVFPNALSAALQYMSLDWPTENGWVNYNSLQQLAYFTTVFIAAPLAALTGVRMSGIWPSNAKTLNRFYPVELARKVHFPVMLYFVLFIVVHVTLVFATSALRNLNHMYAAQGSVDPAAYADNWAGFWIFISSLAVIVGGWIAARPLVLAPVARLFGTVTSR
jgi:thiosulfate reductase cytochrome b subunit